MPPAQTMRSAVLFCVTAIVASRLSVSLIEHFGVPGQQAVGPALALPPRGFI